MRKMWADAKRAAGLACLTLMLSANAAASDFRGHSWGDTQADVIEAEGQPRLELDGRLTYDATLAGVLVDLEFTFTAGALTRAEYSRSLRPDRSGELQVTFATLRKLLGEKYGPPIADDLDFASWDTDRSAIQLFLISDDEGGLLMLTYESAVEVPPNVGAAELEKL